MQLESTKGPPEFPGLMAVSVLQGQHVWKDPCISCMLQHFSPEFASILKVRRGLHNVVLVEHYVTIWITTRKTTSESLQKRLYKRKRPAKVAINSATKLRSIFPTVIVGSDPVLTPHQHWRSSHNLRGGRKTRDTWGTTTLMKIEVMTQGISNGHHQLPDTQFRGITQLHGRKWPVKTSNTGIYCSKETYHHTAETVFSSTFPTKNLQPRILNTSAAQTRTLHRSWNESANLPREGIRRIPISVGASRPTSSAWSTVSWSHESVYRKHSCIYNTKHVIQYTIYNV